MSLYLEVVSTVLALTVFTPSIIGLRARTNALATFGRNR